MNMALCAENYGKVTWKAVFMHEMFHILGIAHTQRRSDRNEMIQVIENNIQFKKRHNYRICENCPKFGPYECNSIMHYKQEIYRDEVYILRVVVSLHYFSFFD